VERVRNLELIVNEIADEVRRRTDRGEVARYIPELANVDAGAFGFVVIDADANAAASPVE
jgi:glutaminase